MHLDQRLTCQVRAVGEEEIGRTPLPVIKVEASRPIVYQVKDDPKVVVQGAADNLHLAAAHGPQVSQIRFDRDVDNLPDLTLVNK